MRFRVYGFWRTRGRDTPCEMNERSLEKDREAESLHALLEVVFLVERRRGRQTPFFFSSRLWCKRRTEKPSPSWFEACRFLEKRADTPCSVDIDVFVKAQPSA